MIRLYRVRPFVAFLFLPIVISCCSQLATPGEMEPELTTRSLNPTDTHTITPVTPVTIIKTDPALVTSVPDPATPMPDTPVCAGNVCVFPGHFIFRSPIADGYNQKVERSYPYGSTQNGNREPHHGVEFINASGTPVVAAGEGKVIFAGNDANQQFGWGTDFYGKLVVIEHNIPGIENPVFTLYGHLSEILVNDGAWVNSGEVIGEVGRTGKALGSHLHFEVRESENDYAHTRNPELWLMTENNQGALVGQIFNEKGDVRRYPDLRVQSINTSDPVNFLILPYADASLNGDSEYNEVFAVVNLMPGNYQISLKFNGSLITEELEISPGSVTRVTFFTEY